MPPETYALESHDRPPPREPDDFDAAPEQSQPGARLWAAAVLVGLVFLVHALTASPMAAAIAGGLKFGWEGFADGIWLFRRDPRRLRGVTMMLAQASRGTYVASLVTCGVAAAADLVLSLLGGPQGRQPVPIADLTVFAVVAAAACVGLTLLWTLLALCSRQLVWSGGGVTGFRRHDVWPPRPRGRNAAPALIGATCYFLVAALAAWAMVVWGWQAPWLPRNEGIWTVSIGLGVASAFAGAWGGRRISARWAENVWPDAVE